MSTSYLWWLQNKVNKESSFTEGINKAKSTKKVSLKVEYL